MESTRLSRNSDSHSSPEGGRGAPKLYSVFFEPSDIENSEKEAEYVGKNHRLQDTADNTRFYQSTKKRFPPKAAAAALPDGNIVVYTMGIESCSLL